MEADELHEVIERLEHAEHEHHSALRATVTVLILIVTVLTALTGLLAARANRHNAEAQRERAVHTVEAQELGQRSYSLFGQYLDLEAASTAAYQRYAIEHRLAVSGGAGDKRDLNREADEWNEQNGVFQDSFNKIDLAKADAAPTLPEQEAFSDARAADAWISKEDANIGVAGLFAVCLFLLGLALTVPGRGVKWGFVGIALLLAVVGVGRALVVNLSSVHRVPEQALEAFHDGTLASYQGDTEKAVEEYRKAVEADGSYTEAWVALAQSRSGGVADKPALREAATSYEKAIDLGEDGYVVHNNLGYVYLLLGENDKAKEEIDVAHELEPEEPFILMSEAEVSLVQGDEATAQMWSDKAVEVLSGFDSAFRNQFFAQLRAADRPALEAAGVPADRLDTMYGHLREVEASLDAFDSAEPRDLNGATVTDVNAVYQKDRGRYEITFSQNDIHTDDITSLRVYNTADESYSVYSSSPRIDVATEPGSFTNTVHTPIDQGTYRIELYLNGHFQTTTTVESPGDA
jgi:tetratricopeptide (TPR) repeat protein